MTSLCKAAPVAAHLRLIFKMCVIRLTSPRASCQRARPLRVAWRQVVVVVVVLCAREGQLPMWVVAVLLLL